MDGAVSRSSDYNCKGSMLSFEPGTIDAALASLTTRSEVLEVPTGPRFGAFRSSRIQPEDGGSSKHDFDHSRLRRTQAASGIGDKAFAFVSAGGFTEAVSSPPPVSRRRPAR